MLVLALVAMSFWQRMTGDTHGLVFEQSLSAHANLTRDDLVTSAMEDAATKAAAFAPPKATAGHPRQKSGKPREQDAFVSLRETP